MKPWEETWTRCHGVVIAATPDGADSVARFGCGVDGPMRVWDLHALQLASAAPDLYRALVTAHADLHASDLAHPNTCQIIIAALRKARGET